MDTQAIGKMLLVGGFVLCAAGMGLLFLDKIPFLGKLPGDIRIEKEHFKFYVPITTCILLSVLVTVILWLISLFKK